MRIGRQKIKIFWCQGIFFHEFGITNGCKKNLRVIRKNLVADPEIVFLRKSISKPYDYATTMPTAWELKTSSLNTWVYFSESLP